MQSTIQQEKTIYNWPESDPTKLTVSFINVTSDNSIQLHLYLLLSEFLLQMLTQLFVKNTHAHRHVLKAHSNDCFIVIPTEDNPTA